MIKIGRECFFTAAGPKRRLGWEENSGEETVDRDGKHRPA